MNPGARVIDRLVADVRSGAAHWVPRAIDREPATATGAATAEARRQHDAQRKARQRARVTGRPV